MRSSLQAYQCMTTHYSLASSADAKTLTVLDLVGLQQAFAGSTVTMTSTANSTYTRYAFVDMYASRTLASSVSNPSGYLAAIKANPPACVNSLNTSCTALYTAAQDCWSEAYPLGPQGCYCTALLTTGCPQLCSSASKDRRTYYNWAVGMCSTLNSTVGANFTRSWAEFQNRTDTYYADLLPWKWTIRPAPNATATAHHCPSTSAKIASFALINAIVGVSTLFLGRRTVVNRLTCGFLGNAGSPTWPLVSLFVVAINLLANFINALSIHKLTGYVVPSIGTLVIFWMSRPRLAWLATALGPVQKEQSMYVSLAASALLTEFVLQSVGAVFIGRTVVFAARNGYYKINALQFAPKKTSALMMFAGALLWVVSIGSFYLYVIWNYFGVGKVVSRTGGWAWGGVKKGGRFVGRGLKKAWPWTGGRRSARDSVLTDNDSEPRPGDNDSASDEMVTQARAAGYTSYRDRAREDRIEAAPPSYRDFRNPSTARKLPKLSEKHPSANTLAVEDRGHMQWEEALERMGLNQHILSRISLVFVFMLLPFVGQWLFWVGFVGLLADQ